MNAIATVTCPKCSAVGSFRHFAHIQAGVCFLCNGAKTVTMTAASRWLASQMRGDMVAANSDLLFADGEWTPSGETVGLAAAYMIMGV